jgi:hypothetical protein
MTFAPEFEGGPEVDTDGLGVPDVQVTIGFRGEPGHDSLVFAAGDILGDDVADEV